MKYEMDDNAFCLIMILFPFVHFDGNFVCGRFQAVSFSFRSNLAFFCHSNLLVDVVILSFSVH